MRSHDWPHHTCDWLRRRRRSARWFELTIHTPYSSLPSLLSYFWSKPSSRNIVKIKSSLGSLSSWIHELETPIYSSYCIKLNDESEKRFWSKTIPPHPQKSRLFKARRICEVVIVVSVNILCKRRRKCHPIWTKDLWKRRRNSKSDEQKEKTKNQSSSCNFFRDNTAVNTTTLIITIPIWKVNPSSKREVAWIQKRWLFG